MNKVNGEFEIELDGKRYDLKCNFQAACTIESILSLSVLQVSSKILSGKIGMKDIVAVLYGGFVGALKENEKPSFTFEQFGELVMNEGHIQFHQTVSDFLLCAIRGNKAYQAFLKKNQASLEQSETVALTESQKANEQAVTPSLN